MPLSFTVCYYLFDKYGLRMHQSQVQIDKLQMNEVINLQKENKKRKKKRNSNGYPELGKKNGLLWTPSIQDQIIAHGLAEWAYVLGLLRFSKIELQRIEMGFYGLGP